ncbi:GTP 3',8-cyclase MoaA [Heliobacterium gestii]|uniref:GTP 3',8-cyclase n=1 Tax=Heliomicrobium gestii TaxID=2699 RepID=A0A845LGU5_HELGE|nr:GTP 3',8-cyclase MoaA [Heliomicrobium gestii]MBM7867379.1 cyclic pyranopterin phosphate synthase [Heliomicrobium gestii]MZP43645.1 GTP 3',8-cyclase MoaA [Heliomicrobium gestii]
MIDAFARDIHYLRVSVTDRCNLRCVYCMPEEGIPLVDHRQVLRFEEFERLIAIAASQGIRRVRITGGEPLVRKGIVPFVSRVKAMAGIEDVALTTNGILLPSFAGDLQAAGLDRVNISLDTLRPERFRDVTRVGRIDDVWAGVEAALAAGLHPVKLNVVVMGGVNDDELADFARLTLQWPVHVRFIELMPIGEGDPRFRGQFVSIEQMKTKMAQEGLRLVHHPGIRGGGPARYHTLEGALGTVGFISAMSKHFCGACNRLRLTAEGKLRPCLHSRQEIDLRAPLRRGAPDHLLARIFQRAVEAKPYQHSMLDEGWGDRSRRMSQIGG